MPVVQMPDGRVIQFPDGMAESEINKALAGEPIAPPATSTGGALPSVPRAVGAFGANVAGGALVGTGGLGSALGLLPDWLGHPSRLAASGASPEVQQSIASRASLPTMAGNAELARRAGLFDNPLFAPQSYPEELLQAGERGLGMSLAMGRPSFGTALATTAGAIGGEAAKPLGPVGEVAAGLVAGTGASGIVGLLNRWRTSPQAVARIAGELGPGVDNLQQAGTYAQQRAWQWMKNEMEPRISQAWERVDGQGGLIDPAATAVPLSDFESTLQKISSRGGSYSQLLAGFPADSAARRLLDRYQNQTPAGLGISPTWGEARQIRTQLGNALKDPGIPGSTTGKDLDNLYRAITGDLDATAGAVSPEAQAAFRDANEETSRLLNFRDKTLKRFVSDTSPQVGDPKPGVAANRLLTESKQDASDLQELRHYMPDVADRLAAAHLKTSDKWGDLNSEARAALVPDEASRVILDKVAANKPASAFHQALEHIATPLKLLGGGFAGEEVGHLLSQYGHALGYAMESPELGNNLRLLGAIAPFVYGRLHNALTNPGGLVLPGLGAVAGNQLTGQATPTGGATP